MKKLKKLIKSPGCFFRDYFNNKYPLQLNEVKCPKHQESVLLQHNLTFEKEEEISFPVDVVFTWVNDDDLVWQKKIDLYKKNNTVNVGRFALDKARFSNHDELRFSVESVLKNIPWEEIFLSSPIIKDQHG